MNTSNLHRLFESYVAQFNFTNTGGRDEYYKWVSARLFKDQWDAALNVSSDGLPDALQQIDKIVGNLASSQYQLPVSALRDYAMPERDPEGVRSLMKGLLPEEGESIAEIQERIDAFVIGANAMKERFFPTSFKYRMDQRAAMVFLGLYDPSNYFLYKATPAREFADCIGFYDDWGTGSNMDISIYFRLCNTIIAEMEKIHNENNSGEKDSIDVLKIDKQRSQYADELLHEDLNHHILVYDLIYCSSVYNALGDIPYKKPDTATRKSAVSRKAYAEQLLVEIEEAQKKVELLELAEEFWNSTIAPGLTLRYKVIGRSPVEVSISGVRKSGSDWVAATQFQDGSIKNLAVLASLETGILSFIDSEVLEKMTGYLPFIRQSDSIRKKLVSLTEEFAQFKDSLN